MSPSTAGPRGSAAVRSSSSSWPERWASRSRTPLNEPTSRLTASSAAGARSRAPSKRGAWKAAGPNCCHVHACRAPTASTPPAAPSRRWRHRRRGSSAPDHRPDQRGHHQGLDDELDDERRDIDAGVVLRAACTGSSSPAMAPARSRSILVTRASISSGASWVSTTTRPSGGTAMTVSPPHAPPRREPHVARPDPALGRHERQDSDRGERAADHRHDREHTTEPPTGARGDLAVPFANRPIFVCLVAVLPDLRRHRQARPATSSPVGGKYRWRSMRLWLRADDDLMRLWLRTSHEARRGLTTVRPASPRRRRTAQRAQPFSRSWP